MRATSARVLDQRVKVLSVPPTSHGDGVCRVLLYLGHLRGPLGRPVAPQTKLSSASHLTPDDLLASSETDTEMRICWCWGCSKECPSGSKRRLQGRFQKPSEQRRRLWNKRVCPRGPLGAVGVPGVVRSGRRALIRAGETPARDGTPRPRQLHPSGGTWLPKTPRQAPSAPRGFRPPSPAKQPSLSSSHWQH